MGHKVGLLGIHTGELVVNAPPQPPSNITSMEYEIVLRGVMGNQTTVKHSNNILFCLISGNVS